MRSIRFNRLFWKIFFAIWLVSISILVATLIFIVQVSDQQRYVEHIASQVVIEAEQLVEEYDRGGALPRHRYRYYRDQFYSIQYWKQKHKPHWKHRDKPSVLKDQLRPVIRIYHQSSGKRIFGPPLAKRPIPVTQRVDLVSEQGNQYRLDITLLHRPSLFNAMFRYLLSYQMVVILLASLIASFLLSWLIVRPLKQLTSVTTALHQGELSSRADRKLSKRGDEIGELAREFNQMADYVEHALHSRQRLLQDVSHELRAPLARLQAISGLAEQTLGGEHRLVLRMHREIEQMDQLIGEILSLSRLEDSEISAEPFQLQSLVDELLAGLKLTDPERKVSCENQQDIKLPQGRALLERALTNILSNAVKHTAAEVPVMISWRLEKQDCVIDIRDWGNGVDKTMLPQLFAPFVRANADKNGYGLGLSIAQRAVERLGGSIQAENHPEGGMLFEIRLPSSLT